MVRKQGKLPNSITGAEYFKEYRGASASGGDAFCIPKGSCRPGEKILIIDDLIATGVSLIGMNSVAICNSIDDNLGNNDCGL